MRAAVLLFVILAGQDFSRLQVEPAAAGFPGGEGPVWSRDGFLIFSDYSRDRLYRIVGAGDRIASCGRRRRGRSAADAPA